VNGLFNEKDRSVRELHKLSTKLSGFVSRPNDAHFRSNDSTSLNMTLRQVGVAGEFGSLFGRL
jgi:hypothetical protein